MVGHHDRDSVRAEAMHPPPQLAQRGVSLEEILSSNTAHREDELRLYQGDLSMQKRLTVSDLIGLGIAVSRRAALQDIGDVHRVARKAARLEHGGQKLPRPPDERLPLAILIGPRGLTHHHPVGVVMTDTEHGLSAGFVQPAGRASGNPRLESLPVESGDLRFALMSRVVKRFLLPFAGRNLHFRRGWSFFVYRIWAAGIRSRG